MPTVIEHALCSGSLALCEDEYYRLMGDPKYLPHRYGNNANISGTIEVDGVIMQFLTCSDA